MIRPLAPFTVRPIKHVLTRKVSGAAVAAAINAAAMQFEAGLAPERTAKSPAPVKAKRRPLRSTEARPTPSLRVIARGV